MKGLIQRVKNASVIINEQEYSKINKGILILLGVEKSDTHENAARLAEKILNLRIFQDENGKMNLSALDVSAEIMVVSQFTLAGSCKKGTRPSFDNAASGEQANVLYNDFVNFVKEYKLHTQTGSFGAMMDIALVNDGPVTF